MATVQLLNFNAYNNRQYKELPEDLAPYLLYTQFGVNFNPNDGVTTSLILNVPSANENEINYCIVTDEQGESLWFVLEAQRTRLNQFEVILRRDLLAEYFEDIVKAPVFIEKATVDSDNPLIFNSEDMTFNQIKTSEMLLKDKSGCPWIVGYFSKDYASENREFLVPVDTVQSYTEYSSLDEVPYIADIRAGTFTGALASPVRFQVKPYFRVMGSVVPYSFYCKTDGTYSASRATSASQIQLLRSPESATWQALGKAILDRYTTSSSWQQSVVGRLGVKSQSEEDIFLSTYSTTGRVIRVGSAGSYEYYKITRSNANFIQEEIYEPAITDAAYTFFKAAVEDSEILEVDSDARGNFQYYFKYNTYELSIEKLADPESYYSWIPANDRRRHLSDAPYDMFAIPYGDIEVVQRSGTVVTVNKDIAMKVASEMAKAMGGTTNNILFDLQLLPYCPIRGIVNYWGGIELSQLTVVKDFTWVVVHDAPENTEVQQIVLFPQESSFSFNISHTIDITDTKVEALCDTYRLVSPNYNGQFEFNAAKNGGVTYFNVDCTYKPYSPYIHINPNFNKLYGNDFNDARGLICGGDFSLPTITDQWISYEINNKNYLNSFNRQIENLEVNNNYQRQAEKVAAIAGTVQGITSGATAGAVTGGMFGGLGMGIGAAVGGVTAGVASGLAGAADLRINDALRAEALDFTIDQFGYSLGNIQALPYSLNRVSAFNVNNKVFPILEYYTCTDTEKEALRNKIKYNGMTVMTIGAISDYIQDEPSYIKGKLIRLEGLDNHTITEISNELNKGFYI